MRKYIKDLIPAWLNGDTTNGHSPLRHSDYCGRKITSMSYDGNNLYSYNTLVGKLDREGARQRCHGSHGNLEIL